MNAEKGIACGVGVGPGDPELITLKAVRIIRESDVIVLPSSPKEGCRAWQIALPAVPEIAEKPLLVLDFPMKTDRLSLDRYHDEAARKIASVCEEGKTAAFLTIGDPSVYSTWAYLELRLHRAGIRTETVCGAASFLAAASALGISLGERDEMIHIIPGSADQEAALALPGTKILMKNKRSFPSLLEKLRDMERSGLAGVRAVSHCGAAEERLFRSAAEIPEDASYLTTVIVKDLPAGQDA